MTTVHEQIQEVPPIVHYRRLPETSSNRPDTRQDSSGAALDVTGRLCVPCAVVGNARSAVAASNDAVPLCAGHVEFNGLSHVDRAEMIRAWSSDGARVGVLMMFRAKSRASAAVSGRAS